MHEVIPEMERRYSKHPKDLLQNVTGQFVNFVKATSCYTKQAREEAVKSICRGTPMPAIEISVDFLQPPKLLTFYLEYQNYFNNLNMTQIHQVRDLVNILG